MKKEAKAFEVFTRLLGSPFSLTVFPFIKLPFYKI